MDKTFPSKYLVPAQQFAINAQRTDSLTDVKLDYRLVKWVSQELFEKKISSDQFNRVSQNLGIAITYDLRYEDGLRIALAFWAAKRSQLEEIRGEYFAGVRVEIERQLSVAKYREHVEAQFQRLLDLASQDLQEVG